MLSYPLPIHLGEFLKILKIILLNNMKHLIEITVLVDGKKTIFNIFTLFSNTAEDYFLDQVHKAIKISKLIRDTN